MSITCPVCRKEIGPDDVNVGADVAYCRACNSASKLSAIAGEFSDRREALREQVTGGVGGGSQDSAGGGGETIPAPDLLHPPRGYWYRDDGMEARVGASCRSVGNAAFMLVFALFWNSVVSVFVVTNIASTLQHMGVSLPAWFPSPSGGQGAGMPLGMTVFLWLFLAPFIAIGLFTLAMAVTALVGHVEVRVREARGTVFVGVGPVGWRRRFDVPGVRQVRIGETAWRENNRTKPVVVLVGEEELRFGSMLSHDKRMFIAGAVRNLLGIKK